MQQITKKFHLSWVNKNLSESKNPLILNGLNNIIKMNPDWVVDINDDHDIDTYLQSMLDTKDYQQIKDDHVVAKCDLWRLLKIYVEGGVYLDLDRYYNIPMSDVIKENVKCIIPTYVDSDFSHDIMISAPTNPIFAKAIELNLSRRHQGHRNVFFLGPQTYMHSVTEVLLGKRIDTNPSKNVLDVIRKEIDNISFLDTYKEIPPYDTLIYRHDKDSFDMGDSKSTDWEMQKRELYKEFGLGHWTNQW